jgi:TonB family protein
MTTLLAILLLSQSLPAAAESPTLVNENRAKAQSRDDVLELRGGDGWMRTEHPLLDFEVRFEIRGRTPDADPGLILRTWTGRQRWPDKGYRLRLPIGTPMDVSSLLTGRQQQLEVLHEGGLRLHPIGEWQRVQVIGKGGSIRVSVNDVVAAEFAVESPGGYLMFDNRKGVVEIRQISLRTRELNEPFPTDAISDQELKKSGGTPPEVLFRTQPVYTPGAMQARIQGTIEMEAVVLANGTVGPVRVVRSRHPDLDIAAVAALKAWRFRPAVLTGVAVPAVITVEMSFTVSK